MIASSGTTRIKCVEASAANATLDICRSLLLAMEAAACVCAMEFSCMPAHICMTAINLCEGPNGHTTCGANSLCAYVGPKKVKCTCNDGYTSPSQNGKNCIADQSCLDPNNGGCGDNSICSQLPSAPGTPGQIVCKCQEGYHSAWIDSDGQFHRDGRNCQSL